ncbi:hypothetical protein [Saccharopolyspora taberi]|uniref:DUF5709 domain-containing protein n=1 Tax=Saccharopolyspora taberi TaxID=60895 RepID=A0ABN3VDP3_9PSEU
MSDPAEGTTPTPDETGPDGPADPANLQAAPDLDEDELGVDPLERGVEPPERWSRVSADRPTPREQREGETLDDRLGQERPEREPEAEPPLAETRMHELDDSVDERAEQEVSDGAGGENADGS